jgi:outer membrane protein assembly factor BamD
MKMKIPVWIALLGLAVSLNSACSPWNRMAKNGTLSEKDSAAMHFYNNKQWDRAHYLFEELKPFYTSDQRYHEIYYYHVTCKYHLGDMAGAMFYYDDYVNKFPSSKYAKEYSYMSAFCTYLMSDKYELDQTYTYIAIEKLQLYLGKYPNSEHIDDADKYIRELIEKLSVKSFEQAQLYLKIGHYKAAVQAFQNMLDEHPDSKLREKATWLQYLSSVKLARVSSDVRKKLRYEESFGYYKTFGEKYKESTWKKQADDLNETAKKEFEKFLVEQKGRDEYKQYAIFKSNASLAFESSKKEEFAAAYNKAMAAWDALTTLNPNSKFLKKGTKTYGKLTAKRQ